MNLESSISRKTIQIFTHKILKGDFSDMLDIPSFYKEVICEIFEVGGEMIAIFAESLLELVGAIIAKAKVYEKIDEFFPQVKSIVEEIERQIGCNSALPHPTVNTKDKYFNDFLRDEEMRLKNPNSSSFYELAEDDKHHQKKKMRMPNLISYKIFNEKWHIAFHTLRKRFRDHQSPSHQQHNNRLHSVYDRQGTHLYRCLSCCNLFFKGINIKHPQFQQLDIIVLCKLSQFTNYKSDLKESICALMNSRGGIILFDCIQQYMDILPRGTYITEKEKELYMQQFAQTLRSFRPKLSLGEHVDLNFVPIVEDPYEKGENAKEIRFKAGKYVVRLRVRNRNRHQLVFLEDQMEGLLTYMRLKGETDLIPAKKTLKYLKSNFNKFYLTQNLKILKQSQHCLEDHRCIEPKIGQMLKNKKKDEQQRQFEYQHEHNFKYTSLLILNNYKPNEMEGWLKSHRKSKYKIIPIEPQSADNLCFFFHETSHRDLKALINTKQPNPPLFLFIQNALQIKNRLPHQKNKELLKFIKDKNSTEIITSYQGDKCYLCAQFKVTLCYMFAKIREMGYQVKIVRINQEEMKNDARFRVIENSLGSA